VSFAIRIPRRVRGVQTVTIEDASALGGGGSAQALTNALAQALGAPSGTGLGANPNPPVSMAALRTAFAAIPQYDGLLAKFGRRAPKRVYRNANLLITGRATLVFGVKPRR
jgi:hypothetical protein